MRRSFRSCPASGVGIVTEIALRPSPPDASGFITGGASAIAGGDENEGIVGDDALAITGAIGATGVTVGAAAIATGVAGIGAGDEKAFA